MVEGPLIELIDAGIERRHSLIMDMPLSLAAHVMSGLRKTVSTFSYGCGAFAEPRLRLRRRGATVFRAPAGMLRRDRPLIHPLDQRLTEPSWMQRDERRPQSRIRVAGRHQGESTQLSQEARTGFAGMEHRPSGQLGPENQPLTNHRVHRLPTNYPLRRALVDYWVYCPATDRVHRRTTDYRVQWPRTGWLMSRSLMADGPQGSLDHQLTCFQATKARRQVGRRHSRPIPPVRQEMDLVKRGS